ncbi:MAG: hypothetical protein LUE24_08270 [Lachnospiraceae bacterium]|nr:hypothetical protein [Lachnospiraceae bacterium]
MPKRELQAAPVDPGAMPHINTSEIPKHVQFSLAQAAYNAIQQDLQRPEFQEGFRRWKAEREAKGLA